MGRSLAMMFIELLYGRWGEVVVRWIRDDLIQLYDEGPTTGVSKYGDVVVKCDECNWLQPGIGQAPGLQVKNLESGKDIKT